MIDAALLSNLPRETARALGRHYIDIGEQLLLHARRAEAMAAERRRRRCWRNHAERVWQLVETQRLAGDSFRQALCAASNAFGVSPEQAEASWRLADLARGRHKRKLRDLDVLRRVCRGQTYREIGRVTGLHPRSVGRIVRAMVKNGLLQLPAQPLQAAE